KYEESSVESLRAETGGKLRYSHPADYNVLAARRGWLPSYPQFDRSSLSFYEEAKKAGDASAKTVRRKAVEALTDRKMKLAIEDPGANKHHPRTPFVWRSTLISSSAKGQEYFLKPLLGTQSGLLAEPNRDEKPEEIN